MSISIKSKKHQLTMQMPNLLSNSTFACLFKSLKTVFTVQIGQPVITKQPSKSWTPVRGYTFIAAVIAAMFFASCQKEKIADTAVNSTTSGSSSAQAKMGWPFPHKGGGGGSTPNAPGDINYGAFIGAPDGTDDESFQLEVADQLGISCLRERVSVPIQSLGFNLVPELNTSYNVLLNFCSPNSGSSTISFVTDLVQYQLNLNNILNSLTVMPAVAVIENEEANRYYYSGSAIDYINQLNAAIIVMHARGIKVANGGITSTGLNYLVYRDFQNQGKDDSAQMFRQMTNVLPNSVVTKDRGAFVDSLLDYYTYMDLDYINFHWKGSSPNTDALNEVINYLKKRTRKKVITNELGQFDTDPNTLIAHVQLCTDQDLPYIIWYSPDENDNKKGTPLQYDNGSLTPTGFAYRDFLED